MTDTPCLKIFGQTLEENRRLKEKIKEYFEWVDACNEWPGGGFAKNRKKAEKALREEVE